MNKTLVLVICAFLMAALAVPFSASADSKGSMPYRAGKAVYQHGASAINNTEIHLTNGLRNVFGLFNPCLDLIKGCTSVVMYPIEKPLDMWDAASAKPKRVKKEASTKKAENKKEEETK
jgi:hypothetical protein